MDWPNESYVRLYVRDTTTWRRLGWDGQCVLMQLIRKVDRAGVLEIGDLEAWEAIMLHIGCSEEVAKRGVEALVRTETVTNRDGRVTLPTFVEAQTCVKSERLRAKESRERRAAGGTGPYGVTKRDDMPSRDVTPPSREITPVTNRHSQLSLAQPSSAKLRGEREPPPEPANDNARSREPSASANAEWDMVLGSVCFERNRAKPVVSTAQSWQIAGRVRDIATTHGVSFHEAARKLAEAGLDAPKGKFAWTCLESDPYAPEPETGVRRGGFAPVSTDFGPPTDIDAAFGDGE